MCEGEEEIYRKIGEKGKRNEGKERGRDGWRDERGGWEYVLSKTEVLTY